MKMTMDKSVRASHQGMRKASALPKHMQPQEHTRLEKKKMASLLKNNFPFSKFCLAILFQRSSFSIKSKVPLSMASSLSTFRPGTDFELRSSFKPMWKIRSNHKASHNGLSCFWNSS